MATSLNRRLDRIKLAMARARRIPEAQRDSAYDARTFESLAAALGEILGETVTAEAVHKALQELANEQY